MELDHRGVVKLGQYVLLIKDLIHLVELSLNEKDGCAYLFNKALRYDLDGVLSLSDYVFCSVDHAVSAFTNLSFKMKTLYVLQTLLLIKLWRQSQRLG